MPTIHVLVGLPATGKSTWVNARCGPNTRVCSTDAYIEEYARACGKTYDEVFFEEIKVATELMWKDFDDAISKDMNIIFDQTNLSVKKRKQILAKVPDHYMKLGVYFHKPDDAEWERRLASRPGKNIPLHILEAMEQNAVMPDPSEGFNAVILNGVGNFP